MSQPSSSPGAVVVDVNVLLAVCTKEPKEPTARTAIADYATKNWQFYAPGLIVGEFLFIACQKLQNGALSEAAYGKAVEDFRDYMTSIFPPPGGEASLIVRAKEIQSGYGCSRSADSLYIALSEELAKSGAAELLTFDGGTISQAAKNAPTVKVNLLPV